MLWYAVVVVPWMCASLLTEPLAPIEAPQALEKIKAHLSGSSMRNVCAR